MANIIDAFKDIWKTLTEGNKKDSEKAQQDRAELESFINETLNPQLPQKEELPDAPTLDRLEYEALSDDEIKAKAEELLKDYKNSNLNAIEDEAKKGVEIKQSQIQNVENSTEEKRNEIESAYNTAKESLSNDSLKRGLARSSIAVNKQSELEKSKADTLQKTATQAINEVNALQKEIDGLYLKRDSALANFNIAYATKIAEKIESLKDTQYERMNEVIKYNNTVSEKEYNMEIENKEKESKLYHDAVNNYQKEKEMIASNPETYKQVYEKIDAYLSSLSKSQALKALESDNIFRKNLTDSDFFALYYKYSK